MPINMLNVVRIGKETTRGTEAGTLPLHMPFLGDGLKIGHRNHLGQIKSSSTFPDVTEEVPLGMTPAVRLTPDVNINTIRDIIQMSIARVSNALNAFSFAESCAGIGAQAALGSVLRTTTLEFSRSDNPDASALLNGTMEFAAMKLIDSSATPGTQAIARRLKLAASSFTINTVSELEILSWAWTITNTLYPGFHQGDRSLRYIEDGDTMHEFRVRARMTTTAWRAIVRNGTEVAASFVLASGTATEDVTLTVAKGQAETHELSGGEGVIEQEMIIRPFRGSGTNAVGVAFGAGIGASALSL